MVISTAGRKLGIKARTRKTNNGFVVFVIAANTATD